MNTNKVKKIITIRRNQFALPMSPFSWSKKASFPHSRQRYKENDFNCIWEKIPLF